MVYTIEMPAKKDIGGMVYISCKLDGEDNKQKLEDFFSTTIYPMITAILRSKDLDTERVGEVKLYCETEEQHKKRYLDKRKLCSGCRNEHYQEQKGGCWCFTDATIKMLKHVGSHDRPPWNHEPKETLSCFRKDGFVMIGKDIT